MNPTYQIGSFVFRLLCQEGIPHPDHLELFRVPDRDPDYTYQLFLSPSLPAPEGTLIARRPDLLVYQTPAGESRLLGITGQTEPYALYRETDPNRAEIAISPAFLQLLQYDVVFTSLLALERRMIGLDSFILHCAYLRYQGKAILFSAPSETGKTTQANLWERYRGAKTINGDRGLLCPGGGQWLVQGWPVCGSSDVCHNLTTPIHAIVMLSQAQENRVERLSGPEAFRLLFSQVTVNRWNRSYVQRAMDLLDRLCAELPVYHLGCTISEEAVTCLEQALFRPTPPLPVSTPPK